nr:glutaredoxin family protein [Abyssicoccus albus]
MIMIYIYTQDQCPPCQFVKQYFKDHQIQFEERNITHHNEYKKELIIKYDAMSTPFILIDDEKIYHVDFDKIEQVLKDKLYLS